MELSWLRGDHLAQGPQPSSSAHTHKQYSIHPGVTLTPADHLSHRPPPGSRSPGWVCLCFLLCCLWGRGRSCDCLGSVLRGPGARTGSSPVSAWCRHLGARPSCPPRGWSRRRSHRPRPHRNAGKCWLGPPPHVPWSPGCCATCHSQSRSALL